MATATKPQPSTKSGAATKVQPLADRVVVRANEREEVTLSGIVLPDTAKEKPQEGTVLAVGPGRLNDKGERVKPEVKTGDTVLYAKYAGTEVKIDGDELLILKESDILAIVK
ncbi:MAG TPA: co-chaperone GroES [Chloroflexota bacterium]|jgi:chaperonin GroES|nr:co-chaperone GroES [Chloroflexota bacterium]